MNQDDNEDQAMGCVVMFVAAAMVFVLAAWKALEILGYLVKLIMGWQ